MDEWTAFINESEALYSAALDSSGKSLAEFTLPKARANAKRIMNIFISVNRRNKIIAIPNLHVQIIKVFTIAKILHIYHLDASQTSMDLIVTDLLRDITLNFSNWYAILSTPI